MFHSNCPLNSDPQTPGYLALVLAEVAKFLDANGERSDLRNELIAVGLLAITPYLQESAGTRTVSKLTKPAEYVRKVIRQKIVEHWQTDRQLSIPPSTRRGMVSRGETPPDHKRHSIQNVFQDDSINPDLWQYNALHKWEVPQCDHDSDWLEIEDTYHFVLSQCQDTTDRAIVEARLDNFRSINDDPLSESVVAEQLGISEYEVSFRLKAIEARSYAAIGRRVHQGNRRSRST